MADVEKVIEGLNCRAYDNDFPCSLCAYYKRDDEYVIPYCDYRGLINDAIELLKDYKVLEKQHEISNELLKLNRRTGKWIEEEPNSYMKKTYCSVCKESAPFVAIDGDYYGRNMHGKTEKTKYCSNCGARMTQ